MKKKLLWGLGIATLLGVSAYLNSRERLDDDYFDDDLDEEEDDFEEDKAIIEE